MPFYFTASLSLPVSRKFLKIKRYGHQVFKGTNFFYGLLPRYVRAFGPTAIRAISATVTLWKSWNIRFGLIAAVLG